MSDCIISPLMKDKDGYPRIKHKGRSQPAGRVLWKIMFGDLDDGDCILHTCDNPSCVNPEHLYKGTLEDNMRDKRERGRVSKDKHPRWNKELDAKMLIELYRSGNYSQAKLATRFGVSQSTVSYIVNGKR